MKILKTIVLVASLAAAGGGLAWYWEMKRVHPSTDDAYVGAHVLTISPQVEAEVVPVGIWTALFDTITKIEANLCLVAIEWRDTKK